MATSTALRIGLRICMFVVFVISFAVFIMMTALVKHELLKTGTLSEGSLAAKLYATLPFDVRQNVYVFNITNRDAFLAGDKPRFQQLGPYVFNLTLRKDMAWGADGALTYVETRKFTFVPELSAGNRTDSVYTVDPVFAVVRSVFDTLPLYAKVLLQPLIEGRSILFQHTVDEILYAGYSDPLANLAHLFKPDLPVINGRIGYLRALNDTDDGSMTVYSGEADTLRRRNEVFRWRGKESIPYYGERCNKLYGTNGELFPAHDPSNPLPEISVFQPMFCKPWTLHFNGSSRPFGLILAKFNTRDDIFSPTGDEAFDRCLQPNGWPQGVFDISKCQHGFPALVSLPHFLRAEQCLQHVEGLEPNISLHDFEMNVHALLGIPIVPAIRVQINVRVHRDFASQSPGIVYPVLWQEIVLAENDSRYLSSIIYYSMTVPTILLSALLLSISGAAVLFMIFDIISWKKKRQESQADEEPIWGPTDDLETDTAVQEENSDLPA